MRAIQELDHARVHAATRLHQVHGRPCGCAIHAHLERDVGARDEGGGVGEEGGVRDVKVPPSNSIVIL